MKRLLRGLVALVTLVAIVGGLPWMLLRYGHWPITRLPDREWFSRLLDRNVSDTTVMDLLTVCVWLVWAAFTTSVLIELASTARGINAPRITLFGPIQRGAHGLVAALVLALSIHHAASTASAATAGPALPAFRIPAVAAVVSGPARLERTTPIVTRVTPPRTVQASNPLTIAESSPMPGGTVTVERGDTAWGIAEHRLGDGMRWRELWDLNRGVPQPDGRAWTNAQTLLPGWVLRLPGAPPPKVLSSGPVDSMAETHTYVVERGDTLSGIARDELGDARRYPEIFDLSRDTAQPGGRHLTNPNLILPGWTVTIPGPDDTPPPPSAPPTPAPEPPAVDHDSVRPIVPSPPTTSAPPPPPAPAPTAAPRTTEAPPTTEPLAPAAAVTPPPTPTAPSSTTTWPAPAQTDHTSDSDRRAGSPLIALALGGSLALATGLAVRMSRLRRARITRGLRDGRLRELHASTITSSIRNADECLINWAATELIDVMRRLNPKTQLGAPEAIEISEAAGIEILWSHKEPVAPDPWTAADGGWAWRLPYDPDTATREPDRCSPLPTLVTIGRRDGRQLLIDLEAYGTIAVSGPPERVGNLLRSIALELAAADNLSNAYVDVVSLDAEISSLPERLRQTSEDEAIRGLRAFADSTRHRLDEAGIADAYRARIGDTDPSEARVAVLMESDDDSLWTALPERCGVAVVAAGEFASARCQITIAEDGPARVEPLGIDFVAASVPAAAAAEIDASLVELTDLLRSPADGPAIATGDQLDFASEPPPAVDWLVIDGPVESDTTADAHGVSTVAEPNGSSCLPACIRPKMLVRTWGKPHIPDRPGLGKRETSIALVIACHDHPISSSDVQDAIWGDNPVERKTVFNLIGNVRTHLGSFDDGTEILPDRHARQLAAVDGVSTDIAVMRRALDLSKELSTAEAIAVLCAAHELMTGPPFAADGYSWAHELHFVSEASQIGLVTTTALVDLALAADLIDVARAATIRAVRCLPVSEELFCLRLRVEHRARNATAVRQAYKDLILHLDDLGCEPSASTQALMREANLEA